MNLKGSSLESNESPRQRFCALEYRQQRGSDDSGRDAPIVLLVVSRMEGLRILMHPQMREIVQNDDQIYIGSLLRDLTERAKLSPDALFKQLTSLSVGPLVTQKAGFVVEDDLPLGELVSAFVELN